MPKTKEINRTENNIMLHNQSIHVRMSDDKVRLSDSEQEIKEMPKTKETNHTENNITLHNQSIHVRMSDDKVRLSDSEQEIKEMPKTKETNHTENYSTLHNQSIEISLSDDELRMINADQELQEKKNYTKRTKPISIFLTPLEFKIVKYRAKRVNLPCAMYCRNVILRKKVFPRLTQSEIRIYERVTAQINLLKVLINKHAVCQSNTRELIQIKDSIKQLVQNSFHK